MWRDCAVLAWFTRRAVARVSLDGEAAVGERTLRKEVQMPFSGEPYSFSWSVVNSVYEVGAVYGLFQYSLVTGKYHCLYVGRTDNLRRRLGEHLNNPPVAGSTHFFAEAYASEIQRKARESALIAEFQPVGNTQGRWR